MAGDAVYGAKRMVDAVVASEGEAEMWKEVFLKASVSYKDISSATAYLGLVPENKRKECFQALGFSPVMGTFSKWALVNGMDSFARNMSWIRNSSRNFRHGTGEFFTPLPGIIEKFRCSHLCRFMDVGERVGPDTMVGLSLPEVTERQDSVLDVAVDEKWVTTSTVTVPEAGVAVPVTVREAQESVLEATYLVVLKPRVREETLFMHQLGPSLAEIASCEFPMRDVSELSGLFVRVQAPAPQERVVGEDVLRRKSRSVGVSITGDKEGGEQVSVLQVFRWLAERDEQVRNVRLEYDGVDYCGVEVESRGLIGGRRVEDLVFADPIVDTAVTPILRPSQRTKSSIREHPCAEYGWARATAAGIQCDFMDVLETHSGFGAYLVLANGRHVEWRCECSDRHFSAVRSAVIVGYCGHGVDKVMSGIWYGWKFGRDNESELVGFHPAMSVADLPHLPTLGLRRSRLLGFGELPFVIGGNLRGATEFVEFEFDRNWFADGESFLEHDGNYVSLDRCACGLIHAV